MYRDFGEALGLTSRAKETFAANEDDLYNRGKRLIMDSVAAGVTIMRTHVEVDTTVQTSCLKIALRLKDDLRHLCDVRISGMLRI